MFKISRYSIYIDDNLEQQLEVYMKKNKFSKRSAAIKDCIEKVIFNEDYKNSMYDIDEKLNRILYRQNLNKKVLEQLFANFGFPLNYESDKDERLKEVYLKNNKYIGRYD